MEYQLLGQSGIKVSRIAFGTWGLGGGAVWSDRQPTVHDVTELLAAAQERGVNYVDTAPVYGTGESERILGEAMKGRRTAFVLQTKCSLNWRGEGGKFEYERDGRTVMRDHRGEAIRKDVEDSLRRLKTDWIDCMVVHRMSETVPVEETMAELNRLREEGKIRAVMLSNASPTHLAEYARFGQVSGMQERFSLLTDRNRACMAACEAAGAVFQTFGALEEGALTGPAFFDKTFGAGDIRNKIAWARGERKAIMLRLFDRMEPLCRKYGCTHAQLALAWALKQSPMLNLLTGFRRVSSLESTCAVFDIALTDEDAALLDGFAAQAREEAEQAAVRS